MAFDIIPDVLISSDWWNCFDFHFILWKIELRIQSPGHITIAYHLFLIISVFLITEVVLFLFFFFSIFILFFY